MMTRNEATERDRVAIMKHIDGLFQAYIRGDRNVIRRGHTTDWLGFQVSSRHLVRGIDQYMKGAEEALATFSGIRYEMLDSEVQVYGEVAVVFYLAKYWIRTDGEERFIVLRSVDIYRQEEGRWNQCGSNICTLPDEG